MSERIKSTVTGLRIVVAATPLYGYFHAVVDLDGPWTADMLAEHCEGCPIGVRVWEGSCEVATYVNGEDTGYAEYEFAGSWRRLTPTEAARLADGLMPLSGNPPPAEPLEDAAWTAVLS